LHTITVSIYGSLKATESVDVNDAEALPLFVELKSVLESGATPKPVRRRRSRGEARPEESSAVATPSDGNEAADSKES
jgi:hypothetical protein